MQVVLFVVGAVIGFVIGRMSVKRKKVSGSGTGHSDENKGGESHNDHMKPSK